MDSPPADAGQLPDDSGSVRSDRDTEHGRYGPKRFVAFIDILGFSDFIEQADKQPELIPQIREALARIIHIADCVW